MGGVGRRFCCFSLRGGGGAGYAALGMKKIVTSALNGAPRATDTTAHARRMVIHALSVIAPCWKDDAAVTIRGDRLFVESQRRVGRVTLRVQDTDAGYEVYYGDLLLASVSSVGALVDDRTARSLRRAFA